MDHNIALQTVLDEIQWLEEVIGQVIKSYLLQEGHEKNWRDIPMPDISENTSPYASKIKEWEIGSDERLALALAMAPHIKPEVLDVFFGKNSIYDRQFTEFGGTISKGHSGFLPTGQTLMFLISSQDPKLHVEVLRILGNDSRLGIEQVLQLEATTGSDPTLGGVLYLNERWMHYFLTGEKQNVEQSASFPAQEITTKLEWEDIVLEDNVMEQVAAIHAWLDHGNTLMNEWGLDRFIKPGYRALFYGPPGTGKTLTTTLLGKSSGRPVYKVDLSMIVSKYIGETEKNLARIFDIAQHKEWILFFDEADALFGKRTTTSSSNDRHVNQQTAYLLQRIEDFPGVVILATNLKANMDEAFTRRFQSMIYFNMPSVENRYLLWKNVYSGHCTLDPSIDLMRIAANYELAGGSIINILRSTAMLAIQRGDNMVLENELIQGIRSEFKKENKTI